MLGVKDFLPMCQESQSKQEEDAATKIQAPFELKSCSSRRFVYRLPPNSSAWSAVYSKAKLPVTILADRQSIGATSPERPLL